MAHDGTRRKLFGAFNPPPPQPEEVSDFVLEPDLRFAEDLVSRHQNQGNSTDAHLSGGILLFTMRPLVQ